MTKPTGAPSRYSTAAIFLHWALALLLLFQASLGWRAEDLPRGPGLFQAMQLHKSIGITILLLTLLRLAIRWWRPRPAPLPDSPRNMALAKAVHVLLYFVMVAGPLTGWIAASSSRIKVQMMLFGAVPWPSLPVGRAWHEPAEGVHGALAWVLVVLFVLHVAGALRHHVKREDLLGRMLPASIASQRALTVGAGIALLGCIAAFAAAKLMHFESAAAAPPTAPTEAAASVSASKPEATSDDAERASPSPSASVSAAAPWRVEPGGRLGFTADYAGSPVAGSFRRWNAEIRFGPEDLANSKIRVSVDLASADTADAERDGMLKSDSFFDVAAHPRAVFTSATIRARGPGRYAAAGTLSLHGATRPVTVNFDLAIDGDRATATGSARLNRSAFGVGSGEFAGTGEIKDAVAISFRLKARRA